MHQLQLRMLQSSDWSHHLLHSSPLPHRLYDAHRVHIHGRNQGPAETGVHSELPQPQLGLRDARLPHPTHSCPAATDVLHSQVPLALHIRLDCIRAHYSLYLCHSHSESDQSRLVPFDGHRSSKHRSCILPTGCVVWRYYAPQCLFGDHSLQLSQTAQVKVS